MNTATSRRRFLKQGSLGAAGLLLAQGAHASLFRRRKPSPNEKLNIGVVGVGNRGGANLKGVSGENIVALCDVDANFLSAAAANYPSARQYNDYRKMLEQRNLDAVVISTPDHTHAVATVDALKAGKHVYCEKPLTHTISEARRVAETARKTGLVTQMGNQIHAGKNYRRVVELVQRGAIGQIGEVHVWAAASYEPKERPAEIVPVPARLNYDAWLGPIQYRPYHPEYLPFIWRHWWAFGGGALADFGCHFMDLPHWALNLGHPLTVEAEGPPVHPEGPPPWLIVRYRYPARETLPAVNLTWYHGGKRPPHFDQSGMPAWGKSGVLFVGDKGMLLSDYNRHLLLPENQFAGFKPPAPFIPDSIGHYAEWIHACKTGGPTTCNFQYGGALTEAVLLGNVAYRTGKKLQWDSKRLKAVGCPEADQFIQHHYRKGWKL